MHPIAGPNRCLLVIGNAPLVKLGLGCLLAPTLALGHEPEVGAVTNRFDRVVVTGRADPLIGIASAASEGFVGRDHLDYRPLQRSGEVLETVPGLIATQHSGAGKANQYFLRGFNLDHGTDFATSLEGMPINLPTHGHGQGYTDLNFLIPELVSTVQYRKGPYYADVGDFGSAGAADLTYASAFPDNFVQAEGGSFNYARLVGIGSTAARGGRLLLAGELMHDDGPWTVPQDFQRVNGVVRWSTGDEDQGLSLTAMAYAGRWTATDQIAERAIDSLAGRQFGTLDPTSGGDSKRFSLSGEWHRNGEAGHTHVQFYGVYYDLDLFSNFTYQLGSPLGDQFEQADRRGFGGLKAHHTWVHTPFGLETETTVGLQLRGDAIRNGLYQTVGRVRTDKPSQPDEFGNVTTIPAVTRQDDIGQVSLAPYAESRVKWSDKIRSVLGIRADYYHFDVRSTLDANSGARDSLLASPKASLIFGPWVDTEFYLSGGMGFHSNDGRGAVTRIDPASGDAVSPVNPLVRSYGAEAGIRSTALRGLQSTLSVWWLDIDSELLFVGDAGSTEASRPSRRYGVEWANYYTPTPWLAVDADVSLSQARFRDTDPAGDRIPGSIQSVVAAGVGVHDLPGAGGFFASLRLRYFGPRALIEDNSERSPATILLNAQAGYRFNRTWALTVDVFNLLDRRDDDITYFYESRLAGEPGAVSDRHVHPVEPLSARVALTARF
jgi:outer membrane receptor protein involved in Fe transport